MLSIFIYFFSNFLHVASKKMNCVFLFRYLNSLPFFFVIERKSYEILKEIANTMITKKYISYISFHFVSLNSILVFFYCINFFFANSNAYEITIYLKVPEVCE